MKFNKLVFKKIKCDEFINTHNHIQYCEAIIYADGDITYAVRSHITALVEITGKSEEYISSIMDLNETPLQWLCDYTECVCVWYNCIAIPKCGITKEQRKTLNKLIESEIVGFKIL